MGIEPTGDGTRLPQGFEDPGGHQSPIQPHVVSLNLAFLVYNELITIARKMVSINNVDYLS